MAVLVTMGTGNEPSAVSNQEIQSKNSTSVYNQSGKWENIGGKWYYTIGTVKQTGWISDGGKWYYLDNSGVMATNTTIDGWKINGSGVATYIGSGNSGGSTGGTTDSGLSNSSTVYITPGGKSYHKSRNCTALKRSTTIKSTTLSSAKAQGKSDPCNLCVK